MTNNCLQPEHGIETEVNKEEYFLFLQGKCQGKQNIFFLVLRSVQLLRNLINFKININNINSNQKISIQIKFGEKQLDFFNQKIPRYNCQSAGATKGIQAQIKNNFKCEILCHFFCISLKNSFFCKLRQTAQWSSWASLGMQVSEQ